MRFGYINEAWQIQTEDGHCYDLAGDYDWLKPGIVVSFELVDTKATNLKPLKGRKTYKVPSTFLMSEQPHIRGWHSVAKCDFLLFVPFCTSSLQASARLRRYALAMGANSVTEFKIRRFLFCYCAQGVPTQVGQPSDEIAGEDVLSERDFTDLNALAKFIKGRIFYRTIFCFLLAFLAFVAMALPFLRELFGYLGDFFIGLEPVYKAGEKELLWFGAAILSAFALMPKFARLKARDV